MYVGRHRGEHRSILLAVVKLVLFVAGMAVWTLILIAAAVLATEFVLRLWLE